MEKKREPGYYWILWTDEWEVGLYRSGGEWLLTGFENTFKDSDFKEIDERPIPREQ